MPNGYSTTSGRTVSDSLGRYGESQVSRLGKALYVEAQRILAESQPLVPVDTGALRASGFVTPPERNGDTVSVELGYGGPAAQVNAKTGESAAGYALYVHENLEAHHPVGQALYLATPFNAAQTGMSERIAGNMKASATVEEGAPSQP